MDIPEVLETTHHYLRRIAHMNDEDPIDVPSMLLQGLQEAAHAAKEELVCECPDRFALLANF